MFGWQIVQRAWVKRILEEQRHLYELNDNLLNINQQLADANHKFVSVAPEWDLDLNQPMAKTLREWLEIKEKHIEELTNAITSVAPERDVDRALASENEELKIRIKELEALVHDLERESRW